MSFALIRMGSYESGASKLSVGREKDGTVVLQVGPDKWHFDQRGAHMAPYVTAEEILYPQGEQTGPAVVADGFELEKAEREKLYAEDLEATADVEPPKKKKRGKRGG